MKARNHVARRNGALPKCPTGIKGLDEITVGGVPRGRTTLLCGGAGCGKTLMGMEFLIRGATQFGEPGVCLSFEESAEELAGNVASLGFDLKGLIRKGKLAIDHVLVERNQIEETGEYDLEALFVRLAHAVKSVGAKRVLLDSVESLFVGLPNEAILRSEMRRLFRWLKENRLTAIVTGERGEGTLTRHGLEEYISDCVILLDHQVAEGVFTRRLRVVKYRGSTHGTNDYPFLIDTDGISVLPVTSLDLKHTALNERVSTGVPALDEMFGGDGYFRGSSILISGTAGTGKTSLAAQFVDAACSRGERCVMFSFEESASQALRNMKSIGLNLSRWVDKGLLQFHGTRPTMFGLEMHLVRTHKIIESFDPQIVVVDPVTGLFQSGSPGAARGMLLRLVDLLKARRITALMTSLTSGGTFEGRTDAEVSSLVDAWILLRDIESSGERNRGLYILKARGIAHSNQIREFILTNHGIQLRKVYLGGAGVLTGSARVAQESSEAAGILLGRQEIEKRQLLLLRKRKAIEAQIAALQLELDTEEQESKQAVLQEEVRLKQRQQDLERMAESRSVGSGAASKDGKPSRVRGGGK